MELGGGGMRAELWRDRGGLSEGFFTIVPIVFKSFASYVSWVCRNRYRIS